jgi:hypothetical protein
MIHFHRINKLRHESFLKNGPGSSDWSKDEKVLASVAAVLVVILVVSILVRYFR